MMRLADVVRLMRGPAVLYIRQRRAHSSYKARSSRKTAVARSLSDVLKAVLCTPAAAAADERASRLRKCGGGGEATGLAAADTGASACSTALDELVDEAVTAGLDETLAEALAIGESALGEDVGGGGRDEEEKKPKPTPKSVVCRGFLTPGSSLLSLDRFFWLDMVQF